MKIQEQQFVFPDGKVAIIKSATECDALLVKAHHEKVAAETYFMARYPDDGEISLEARKERLLAIEKSECDFLVNAYVDGKIIADLGVICMRNLLKMRHRAYLGMSVQKDYWGKGLGTFMIKLAIEQARKNGFEQLELGVFSDNEKAIHPYEKVGFKQYGYTPRAFKLKDGTYRDEIIMAHIF